VDHELNLLENKKVGRKGKEKIGKMKEKRKGKGWCDLGVVDF